MENTPVYFKAKIQLNPSMNHSYAGDAKMIRIKPIDVEINIGILINEKQELSVFIENECIVNGIINWWEKYKRPLIQEVGEALEYYGVSNFSSEFHDHVESLESEFRKK